MLLWPHSASNGSSQLIAAMYVIIESLANKLTINSVGQMIRMHGKMVGRKPLFVKFAYGNGPGRKQKLKAS